MSTHQVCYCPDYGDCDEDGDFIMSAGQLQVQGVSSAGKVAWAHLGASSGIGCSS